VQPYPTLPYPTLTTFEFQTQKGSKTVSKKRKKSKKKSKKKTKPTRKPRRSCQLGNGFTLTYHKKPKNAYVYFQYQKPGFAKVCP